MSQPPSSASIVGKPAIIAFVGENANGILTWWTKQILVECQRHGFAPRLVDMTGAGWHSELADVLIAAKPVFCFSFQGFGMNLQLNGENYWAANRIPFLSYLGDSPHHAPSLHAAEGAGLQLLYSCRDFLQTYRLMGGPLYATTFRYGFPENPHADRVPWGKRTHRIVYVKTAVDAVRMKSEWADLPKVVGAVVDQCSGELLAGASATVPETCKAAFEAHDVHYGVNNELFLAVCSRVDFYVRAVRAERMVQALMAHDAVIVGDWSHMDRSAARARFCSAVPADTLDALYADTQVVINTSPSVRHGMHERIMAGLMAKAAVVSDTTPFLDNLLAPCPSFKGVAIDARSFTAHLGDALASTLDDPDMPGKVDQSACFARAEFGLDTFVLGLLEQIRLEGYRRSVEGWSFPPGVHSTHASQGCNRAA